MAIFNSYVKLPEGKFHDLLVNIQKTSYENGTFLMWP